MGYDIRQGLIASLPTSTSFGDVVNKSGFELDGTLLFEGKATVFKDLLPTAVYPPTGAAAPNITLLGGTGGLKAQEFPNSGDEEFHPTWQIGHEWKEGTAIVPHLHIYVPNNANGGIITFTMNYSWCNVNNQVMTNGTLTGNLTILANAGINSNAILSFGELSGVGKLISSLFASKIMRSNSDTFNGSCWIRSADLHIECDTVGSRTSFTK